MSRPEGIVVKIKRKSLDHIMKYQEEISFELLNLLWQDEVKNM